MTVTGDSRARFSELDRLELPDYRPLNRCAVATFVLGLLSPISLAHPGLIVLPLVAIVLGVTALRQMQAAEVKQSGRALAVVGFYLAILFGTWTGIHQFTRSDRLSKQAREFAEQWLFLLRDGKTYEAHQLVMRQRERVVPGTSLDQHYSVQAAEEHRKQQSEKMARSRSTDIEEAPMAMEEMGPAPLDNFNTYFNEPFSRRLKEMGRDARILFRETGQIVSLGANDVAIEVLFEVIPGSPAAGAIPARFRCPLRWNAFILRDRRPIGMSLESVTPTSGSARLFLDPPR
jgi:hypothetical protein